MKKTGLCTEGNWYKGNLHLHSTNSDGVRTPEEVAKVYREHGYDFISFTEHEHYTYNQELDSEHFLIIPGTELSCEKPEPFRIYHMLGLGQDKAMDREWAKNGEIYTHGENKLSGEELYVRVEVIDHRGKTAWSNPIFIRNQ